LPLPISLSMRTSTHNLHMPSALDNKQHQNNSAATDEHAQQARTQTNTHPPHALCPHKTLTTNSHQTKHLYHPPLTKVQEQERLLKQARALERRRPASNPCQAPPPGSTKGARNVQASTRRAPSAAVRSSSQPYKHTYDGDCWHTARMQRAGVSEYTLAHSLLQRAGVSEHTLWRTLCCSTFSVQLVTALRQGWPELYIYTVYDLILKIIPAKTAVYTPDIYRPTLHCVHTVEVHIGGLTHHWQANALAVH
jgi:hypothetical protein